MLYSQFTFGDSTGFIDGGLQQYEVDSKAMRKVDIGQDLVIVGELAGPSQGFVMTVGGRILVKVN